MSNLELNKKTQHHIIEVCHNQKNLEQLDECFDENFIDHHAQEGQSPGLNGYKDVLRMTFTSFPDMHVATHDMIAEGDLVVYRGTVSGTNTGDLEMAGLPATGKKMEFMEIMITRFENGKVVEVWGLRDEMAVARQLGLMSPMTLVKKAVYAFKKYFRDEK